MPIRVWKEELGKFELFKWENGLFKIIKTRRDCKCYGCEKIIKKGCYALGSNSYYKICVDCYDKFYNNFTESLREQKQVADKVKEYLEKHKGEIMKNNVINSV